jgi:SNF2 family DNA or RNA helicase
MYRSRLKPYAHQKTALQKLRCQKAFALWMAMRTGKTKVVLDDFGRLADQGEVFDLLIIAPAGAYLTWAGEVEKHFDPDFCASVYAWSAQDRKTDRLERFLQLGGIRILLVNVEALSSVKRARDLCEEFLSQRKRYSMLVVDESTTIKNRKAERTKFLLKVLGPLAEYRRVLSGLPTPRSPLDAWAQFEFLKPGMLGKYASFERQYAVTRMIPIGGRKIRIVVGYRRVAELADKLEPHRFRVLLKDCYDLPEKIYVRRIVPLHPDQERVYKDVAKKAMAQLSDGAFVTATAVITQMLRLHQILCGHVVDELGDPHVVPEHRTRELLALLEEHEGKAIIWCSYQHSIEEVTDALREAYGEHSVARFWGGNKPTRESEELQFKTNPACRFMVATPSAGGRGRDWSAADLVVYYSSTPDLEHRAQSEDRAQKVGKGSSVLYVDLVAPGTVDEKFLKALREKINLSATITQDTWQEWVI